MSKASKKNSKRQIYQDLCYKVLSETDRYPWSPETAESYYEELDTPSNVQDYLDSATATQKSEEFFKEINQLYPPNRLQKVNQALVKQFGELVPLNWLEAIAQQGQNHFQDTTSGIDKLLNCVQPLLSNWLLEDLAVFARPVANTMRGAQTIPQKNWTELSEVEQARLTLIIAKVALESYQNQSDSV